jgi:hypothetical protein
MLVSYQDRSLSVLEVLKDPASLLLILVAMNSHARKPLSPHPEMKTPTK